LTRIVFWNVNRSDLTDHVCSIAATTHAEVIILNENSIESESTLSALRTRVSEAFYIPSTISESRFHCFCRCPALDLSEVHSGFRTSARKLWISNQFALLALVHGVDMRNYDPESRQSFAQSVATEMQLVKEHNATNRLIILGDFNMNPFDRGMNLAPCLNAMMTTRCVAAGTRRHLGDDYDLYYNPMWSLFGDRTPGPAGTTYDTSNQGPYGWNMLDQVILSYTLVDIFEQVEILSETGAHSLVDQHGRPDSGHASDHLPIMLTLREGTDV
jgi:exonuclease III